MIYEYTPFLEFANSLSCFIRVEVKANALLYLLIFLRNSLSEKTPSPKVGGDREGNLIEPLEQQNVPDSEAEHHNAHTRHLLDRDNSRPVP